MASNTINSRTSNIKINSIQYDGSGINRLNGVISGASANSSNVVEEYDFTVSASDDNLTAVSTSASSEELIYLDDNYYCINKYSDNGNMLQCDTYNFDRQLISSVSYNDNGNVISRETFDSNGNSLYTMKYEYDAIGNVISGSCNGDAISIFGDYVLSSKQYGGSQMDFKENVIDLLEDGKIINILKEYFPDATMEDFEFFLKKLCNVGCGYVAQINTLFKQFEGKEGKFLNTFGFPMYNVTQTGGIDFNYEYLIVEYFSSICSKTGYTIKQIYSDILNTDVTDAAISGVSQGGLELGLDPKDISSFSDFLKSKFNVNVQGKFVLGGNYSEATGLGGFVLNAGNYFFGASDFMKKYESSFGSDYQVILNTQGFDLYLYDEITGGRGELYSSNVGAHGMTITGVTPDGNFVVSSWGKKYVVSLENISKNGGFYAFQGFKY